MSKSINKSYLLTQIKNFKTTILDPLFLGLQTNITNINSDIDDITNLLDTKQSLLTFDDTPTLNSDNPVKSGGIYAALQNYGIGLTLDDEPTLNSDNPVKSNGIKLALDSLDDNITSIKNGTTIDSFSDVESAIAGKQNVLTFDNSPTSGSNNPVKSSGIKAALDAKQNTLTFDNSPTLNSNNPVKSNGIKVELNEIDNKITNIKNGTNINNFSGVESAISSINSQNITQNNNIDSLNSRVTYLEPIVGRVFNGVLRAYHDYVNFQIENFDDNSLIDVYTSKFGLNPTSIDVFSLPEIDGTRIGDIDIYFEPQSTNVDVCLRISTP